MKNKKFWHPSSIQIIFFCALVILLSVALSLKPAHAGDLPDSVLTPGVTRTVTLHDLCTTLTGTIRNVPDSLKKAIYAEYGLKDDDRTACSKGFEIDHLISLELGGSNDRKNLWPQSYCGTWNAKMKDALEDRLAAMVCKHQISLQDAQTAISGDWTKAYTKYGGIKK
jgi:hypothetical protein